MTDRPGSVSARLAATRRVLVVEDEHDIVDFLRAFFRASGYDVVHVDPDGPGDVVAAVAAHRPDCVLLDIRLRGFSGLDAYRLLRSDPAAALVPVIVVTADGEARGPAARLAGGIDGFVAKPFHVQALEETVADRIARAAALAAAEGGDDLHGPEYLDARLADEMRMAKKTSTSLVLALLRLHGLGDAGRSVGDEAAGWVLRAVAREMGDGLPAAASVCRTAGDELALLLPATAAEAARVALEVLTEAASGVRTLPGGATVELDVRAGVAGYPEQATDPEQLYMAADGALHDALGPGGAVVVAL